MGRTSLKNKLILSFLALLLIVLVVVGVVNRISDDFFLAQAISAVLALIAGIIFGSMFSKSLVNRLNSLSNVAREISRGDLSRDIPLLSLDEVRDLEEIFSTMVDDLRAMILDLKNVSQQIRKTNRSLSSLVKKVVANSKEIDQSAKLIAKGSEEQTLIVQKTSLSLDNGLNEMDEMVRQSAETVSKVNEARLKTEKGEAEARETLGYLDDVLKQMVENTQPIFQLANKVEKIKMVVSVIDDIARKTDLLSLNASIEATRAGETGKGFALVADEIRSMADNSKRSSQDIRKMIENILEDNQAVSAALAKSQEGINHGRRTIHRLVDTFGETLKGVKDRQAGKTDERHFKPFSRAFTACQ
ncbi:MAG: methyl-accepting chemotaxis protein [Deltaproteobacteria bacterium]|nr:methyl-accepting chemotaxis protein [Deltaproteobacteria bacterium]